MTDSTAPLWERYLTSPEDADARDRLIQHHMGLVYETARRHAKKLPAEIEFADLVGAGTVGLMQALEDFDPGRGFAFSTFAMPRIRGAILDDLRRKDPASRSVRQRERMVQEARQKLEQQFGRAPSDLELAEAIGVDQETLFEWQQALMRTQHLSMDRRSRPQDDDEGGTLADILPSGETDASESLETQDLLRRMVQEMEHLKPQQRLVLALYYHEDLKLHEIANILNLTESRISQVRSEAIKTLRRRLEAVA